MSSYNEGMEQYFDDNTPWSEVTNDHIREYDFITCAHCEGPLRPVAGLGTTSVVWQHVLAIGRDHSAVPVNGTFDMFPRITIESAAGHAIAHYYG